MIQIKTRSNQCRNLPNLLPPSISSTWNARPLVLRDLVFSIASLKQRSSSGPTTGYSGHLVFVGGLIGSVVPLLLIGPIYCGIGLCFLAKEKGQQPSFELMFKGFEQFMESLIPVLLYSIALIVIIPCYMGGLFGGLALISSGEEVGFILGGCLIIFGVTSLILGSTFMSYGYLFSTFLVADYKLEGMDAFNISLSGIQKNFFGLLGITIASAIIGIVGMMLCYIPFLLMLPLFMGGPFICYRKIFRDYAKSAQKPVKIDIAE